MIVMGMFCFGCERELNIAIPTDDKRLLVDGEFTNESAIHRIRLYCSGGLLTGTPQTIVTGAKVFVTDKTDTFYYHENKDTLGLYQTDKKCAGEGGITYYLSISNVDINNDGMKESYSANEKLPMPIEIYSLISKHGLDGDNHYALNNKASFKIKYGGPEYLYPFIMINNIADKTLTQRLGSGELNSFETDYKLPQVSSASNVRDWSSYVATYKKAIIGDVIGFVGYNFTKKQYSFLKEFDNNSSGDILLDNMYDQLNIPCNVSTNIEPSDKAAGYFFIYSISRKSIVLNE
jgi:hypothetical protein